MCVTASIEIGGEVCAKVWTSVQKMLPWQLGGVPHLRRSRSRTRSWIICTDAVRRSLLSIPRIDRCGLDRGEDLRCRKPHTQKPGGGAPWLSFLMINCRRDVLSSDIDRREIQDRVIGPVCAVSNSLLDGFIAFCCDADERHERQAVILRAMPAVRGCNRQGLCGAFGCFARGTTR